MPKIEIRKEKTKTVITNLKEICKSLNRKVSYLVKFLEIKLCLKVSYNSKTKECFINGSHDSYRLQEILQRFISEFVLCEKCNLPETLNKVSKLSVKSICNSRGNQETHSEDKLTRFIIKSHLNKALDL